jgi:hypothetical protein
VEAWAATPAKTTAQCEVVAQVLATLLSARPSRHVASPRMVNPHTHLPPPRSHIPLRHRIVSLPRRLAPALTSRARSALIQFATKTEEEKSLAERPASPPTSHKLPIGRLAYVRRNGVRMRMHFSLACSACSFADLSPHLFLLKHLVARSQRLIQVQLLESLKKASLRPSPRMDLQV